MTAVAVSWPALLSILTGIGALPLARLTWRYRDRPGATYWTILQVAISLWTIAYGLMLLVFDPTLHRLFNTFLWFVRAMAVPLILLFALEYTGRDRFTTPRIAGGLVGFWVLVFVFVITNPIHHLAWTGYHVDPVFGAAATAFTPEIGLLIATGTAYLFNSVATVVVLGPLVNYRRLFSRQALIIALGLAAPTVANLLWLFRIGPTAHLDLTPLTFLVTVSVMYYALFREELFELIPATSRIANDIAIDDINAAVFTVAPHGRLVDLNRPAVELFDVDRPSVLGRPLDTALGVDVPLESTQFTLSNPQGHSREFDIDVSPIESRSRNLVGYIVTFYDITDERRRQQRLAVQNRILRHNLRNKLTIVDGHADLIDQLVSDEEVQALLETIQGASRDLTQISKKVRRLDAGVSTEPTSVDLCQLCRTVADEMASRFPDATVEVETEATTTVYGRDPLLRQIVKEVVENAIVHDQGGRPNVVVSVASSTDEIVVSIVDEGPGIPTAELEALESGAEDPLTHGSGIGLWIVQWGMDVIGGSVSFESGTDDGTVVTLTLPNRV